MVMDGKKHTLLLVLVSPSPNTAVMLAKHKLDKNTKAHPLLWTDHWILSPLSALVALYIPLPA
jgi:hypothetical protein